MKTRFVFTSLFIVLVSITATAQEVRTLFGQGRTTGGYGALSNKVTTIGGGRVCQPQ